MAGNTRVDNVMPHISLNNGAKLPVLGLGTWQMPDGKQTEEVVAHALEIGYRLIDTAAVYGNEASIGQAIKASGVPRKEIFITTKLWNSDQGSHAEMAFHKSLARLGLDYVDLYLIHWPAPAADRFVDTWRILEKLYKQKLVRAIGISNFNRSHLEKLLAHSTVVPAVNQIELHPHFQEKDLVTFCKEKSIKIESYSPLGGHGGSVLQEDSIKQIAFKYNKSPAQIVLRWHIQQGYIVIPKASRKEHLAANLNVFNFWLSQEDMAAISALEAKKRRGPDPDLFNSGIKTGLVQLAHKFNMVKWQKEKK
jgi:diketogulonate reductase-like aldo/keto reductase